MRWSLRPFRRRVKAGFMKTANELDLGFAEEVQQFHFRLQLLHCRGESGTVLSIRLSRLRRPCRRRVGRGPRHGRFRDCPWRAERAIFKVATRRPLSVGMERFRWACIWLGSGFFLRVVEFVRVITVISLPTWSKGSGQPGSLFPRIRL